MNLNVGLSPLTHLLATTILPFPLWSLTCMLGTTLVLSGERLVEDRFGSVEGGLVRYEVVVKLLAEEVGMCHLDADGVAEGETMVGLTPDEAEVAVVEVESLIPQETHGDESFAVVLVNFGIDTKFVHAADVGIEFLTEFVRHKLDLLVIDAGTFGSGSELLHLRGVCT